MEYKLSSSDIDYTCNEDGTVEFMHEGVLFRSIGQPTFDNSPNNNFSTYSAPLVCPNDADDAVGEVVYEIINDSEDESEACDWCKFDVYLL